MTEKRPVSLKGNSTVSIVKDSGTLAAMLYLVRSIILIWKINPWLNEGR